MQVFGGVCWRNWLVVVLSFAGTIKGKTQVATANYRMRAITVNNGLPQGWVTDVTQDSKGFVWMISSGLVRYDGRTFTTYQHQNGDFISLVNNNLSSVQPDNAGNLWIIYNPSDAKAFYNPIDVFNTATGKVRHISEEAHFSWMRTIRNVNFIVEKGGSLFLGNHQQLVRFNFQAGVTQAIPLPLDEALISIGEDQRQQVWVTTTKHLCKLAGNILIPVATLPEASALNTTTTNLLLAERTYAEHLFEDAVGNIVTLGLGCVFVYQPATGKIRVLPVPISKKFPVGLVKATNSQFYFLLDGNIWSFGSNAFKSAPVEQVAGENFTAPLLADKSGTVWATKEDATGMRLYNFQTANFHPYPYKNGFSHDVLEPWLHNPVSWLDLGSYSTRYAKDSAGNVWVLNYSLKKQNGETSESATLYQLTSHGSMSHPYGHLKPNQITFDQHNQLWILGVDSTSNFILAKINPATNASEQFAKYPIDADNRINGYLSCTDDKIVVIDGQKLRVYDAYTKKCTIYNTAQLGFDKTLLMTVPDPNDKQQIWITSQGSGISKLNLHTGQVVHLTEANGLLNNTVYMMVPDQKGFFWCSSNKGLFRFNPQNHSVVSFGIEDGLAGNEFNRFHFIETPDGHFVFGGTEGYTVFHPDSVYIDTYQPTAVISSLLINNQPLSATLPQLKDGAASSLQTLELDYNQNFVTFYFSALQFSNPQKIRYRYQLQGIDKDWIIAGADASAVYTFLPPGTYVLKVNASNTDGIWSSKVKTLKITILPPWWKTGWAYLLYLVAAVVIISIGYKTWLRRVQTHQQIILQQKEAEQLRAIDKMKSRFFSNITHELRTPLTLITAPLEEIQRNGAHPDLKVKIQGVQRNAQQLLHLINQLLDLAKLEANSMPVYLQQGNLSVFIKAICDSFLPQATAKQLSIHFDSDSSEDLMHLFDADKLQKIIANLLSNAVKFTLAGGQVKVTVGDLASEEGKNSFTVSVADTGIGIPPEQIPFIFNRFYQADNGRSQTNEGTGIGLALVKELVELMKGTITVSSDAANSGTTFLLILQVATATGSERAASTVAQPIMPYYEQPDINHQPENQLASDKPVILVTEDNSELRAFIASSLNTEYRVLTAGNGKEGLEKARQEIPDIIISDARMPEMDGFRFCEAIKQSPETSHIAFVLLTAKATQQSRIEGLQNQADDYITKPFQVEELQLRIGNILRRQQRLRLYYNRQLTVPEEALVTPPPQDPFLQQLYTYLDSHLEDVDLTVEKLAVAARVSQRTLTRKLNAVAGISGVELIKQYRLKKAAEILLNGSTVSEAAFATGYDNPNYFSTTFKSFYGVSPTEYVRQTKAAEK